MHPDILSAGMIAIAQNGWLNFHPFDIVLQIKGDHTLHFKDREDFLIQALKHLDHQIITSLGPIDQNQTLSDRLFDALMTRFEIFNPYKHILQHVVNQWLRNPGSLLACFPSRLNSFMTLIHHIDPDAHTLTSKLHYGYFMIRYARVVSVWLQDNSDDLSSTLASLHQETSRFVKTFSKKS